MIAKCHRGFCVVPCQPFSIYLSDEANLNAANFIAKTTHSTGLSLCHSPEEEVDEAYLICKDIIARVIEEATCSTRSAHLVNISLIILRAKYCQVSTNANLDSVCNIHTFKTFYSDP